MLSIFLLWTLLYIFSLFIEASYFFNTLYLLAWFFTCFYILSRNSTFAVISLPLLFAFSFAGLSCYVAEYGLWFSEIKEFAYLSGSLTRILSLSALLICSAYYIFISSFNFKLIHSVVLAKFNGLLLHFFIFFAVILTSLLFYVHFKYGHPNDYGVDRFYYFANIAPSWVEYSKFLLFQSTVFIGLAYGKSRSLRYIVLLLLSLAAQYAVGEKFTNLFGSLLLFLIPFIILQKVELRLIIKNIKFLSVAGVVCLGLMFSVYLSYSAMSGEDAVNRFLDRLVLQSQLWWSLDAISSVEVKSFNEIWTYLFGLNNSDIYQRGIFYIMYLVSPEHIYNWFVSRNITMTMGGPVNLLYFFGYFLAYPVAIILGLLLGFIYVVFYKAIKHVDVLLILLSVKGLDKLQRAIAMGDFHHIFSIAMALNIFLFFIYILISYSILPQRKTI